MFAVNTALSDRLRAVYAASMFAWLAVAVLFVVWALRPSALVVLPMVLVLWYAARSERLSQSAQLVWPVLLLPGMVSCFIGFMQSMNYGRMENEPDTQFVAARGVFFVVGLLLHFAAYVFLATESRAADHPSGDIANKI